MIMIDRCCISLNNNCNLRCKYCHFQDKQKDFSFFQTQQVLKILDNIHFYCKDRDINLFKLGIVGSGEPMLKKEVIFSMLEWVTIKKYTEIKMYCITNGTLLKKNDIKKFYQYNDIIDICFSLDGYEEIHNYGRAKYVEVMKSIEMYKDVFNRTPSINATVNALSIKNQERLIMFFKENKLFNITFSKLVGYKDADLHISDMDFSEFMRYVEASGLICRQFKNNKKYDCTMYGRLCGVGRTNVFITPEGIYPCGRFYKDDRFLLGKYNDDLFEIEKKLSELVPVEDGKCYYSQNVEGYV